MSSNRGTIEDVVEENPGISFIGLKRETGLSNGVIQHHVRKSPEIQKKKGAILPAGICEECSLQDRCGEKCLRGVLRKQINRRVLDLASNGHRQVDIAEELELDRSTVCYHFRKLEGVGLLEQGEVPELVRDYMSV